MGSVFKAIAWLLNRMGHPLRNGLAFALAWLWFDVLRIRRHVILENLLVAFPDVSHGQRVQMGRKNVQHLLLVIFEYGLLTELDRKKAERDFDWEGLDLVRDRLQQQKGLFLLGMHMGNGDLAIAAFSRLGFPTVLISKLIHWKRLNDMWFGMRARHGTRFIAPERSSFEIMRSLKKNEIVIFVLDQFMGPPVGCRTLFFGKETGTAMGLATLHLRSNAPVLVCWTERQPNGRHKVIFQELSRQIDLGPDATVEDNIHSLTQMYTDKIESVVRSNPTQWMWIHRRWKIFGW